MATETQLTHQALEFISREPTDTKYLYRVDVFSVDGDETRDFARVEVVEGGATPPQLVLREGEIIDCPVSGEGTFLILRPGGELEKYDFDDRNPQDRNNNIHYGKGSYIAWVAGERGLVFVEVCCPPYKQGDLKNLDVTNSDTPEAFRVGYQQLVEREP